jgi:hypothetical protein
MDNLDHAVMRRFDLKIKFDYLAVEGAWSLLQSYCKALGLPEPETALRPRLKHIANLTPGDFACVARRSRFAPLAAPADLVTALRAECELKKDTPGIRMGFLATC